MLFVLRFVLLCGVVVCSSVFASEADLDAKQMLEAMKKAKHGLNYQGTVAIYKNGKLDTMKITHLVSKDDVEQERLLSLNSPLREIVMDPDKIRCEFHDTNETVIMLWPSRQSFFPDLPANLDDLDSHYRFNKSGVGVIANQSAFVIDVYPKDDYRYARRIWVSQQNYLPLKFILFDQSGMAMEQVVFSNLQLLENSVLKIPVQSNKPGHQVYQFNALPFEQAKFVLINIPKGFNKVFLTRRPMHGNQKLIDHLLLSDGFSSVSVYFEEIEKDLFAEQHAIGAINSYSRRLGDHLLTVMGEVPKRTVKLIAEGAKLRVAQ